MENNALFSYRRKPGMNTITVNKKGDRGGGRVGWLGDLAVGDFVVVGFNN